MTLKNIEILQMRNYDYINLSFCDSVNIFYGKNAQGKTNLLEAIYFLGITKSHRTSNDRELIKENCTYLRVNGLFEEEYSYNLRIDIENNRKKCYIDGSKQKKIDDYIGKMKVVLFCPEDLNIIKGLPVERREYLDVQISQFSLFGSKYYSVLNEFNNILKKRNNILKSSANGYSVDKVYLEILTKFLINKIVYIYNSRKKYISRLNDYIDDIYYTLTGYKGLKIVYKTDVNVDNYIEENLEKLFKSNEDRELIIGSTLIGPQKDDLDFLLNGKDVKKFCSQGQQRMAVIALKMASIEILRKYDKVEPILLLDDVFSELDSDKRTSLFKYIYNNIQTFITTTDLSNLDEKLVKKAKIFKVDNGNVVDSGEVREYGK